MQTPSRRPGPKPQGPLNLPDLFVQELERHPLNASDLTLKFNTNRSRANKVLTALEKAGRVHKRGGSRDIKWHAGPVPPGYVHKPSPNTHAKGPAAAHRAAEANRNKWGPSPWEGLAAGGFTRSMAARFEQPTSDTAGILRPSDGGRDGHTAKRQAPGEPSGRL